MRQKIGVVGAGAVGTYFGVRLAELGHDVRFLLKSGRAAPPVFRVESWQGDFTLERPHVAREPRDLGGDLDWVFVCLKSTSLVDNGAILDSLVTPAMGDRTRVQLLMNGLGAEELAASRYGANRVHGGLVYGGLTRLETGRVRHEGVGAEIRGGSFVDDDDELHAAASLWAGSQAVNYTPQPCLLEAQWSKLAWNIPFNGLTVAAGGVTVRDVWERPDLHAAAIGLMREICAAANANLEARDKAPRLDESKVVDQLSAITDKMAAADYIPSTTLDFRANQPMEIDHIFVEPLRRAASLDVHTPRLELLAGLLQVIDAKRAAAAAAAPSSS
ncbi:hypothetical protein CTAYLR_001952 [Chrysophaeum taylorii]|uniref:2-dehydropantoate 2-reductase n=1 Tax=Chrysophaeum taylorii TaxID=2483200 RepID=A0AAD7XL89_9STRA|nr:hypothetical protein CTAYLR_001952 [Chrysophaeum taylorii]